MDYTKYQTKIWVCALQKNLEMMEFGNQIEIGEQGINLSCGQNR